MRVLVVVGSERGTTAEVAAWIAEAIRAHGFAVDLAPIAEVHDLRRYSAAVIGSSVQLGRWQAGVRRFVRRHTIALRSLPVWLFDTGPVGELGPSPIRVRDAEDAMARTDAIGHVTLHERADVEAWAHGIARSLRVRGALTG